VRALPLVVTVLACACGTEKLEPRPLSDATVEAPGPADEVFAVSFFRLGITKRDGEATTEAWKQYGFNLDGICTTSADSETSKGTCQRIMGSEADTLTDGDSCIDNNFGSKLIPMIRALDPLAEEKIGDGISKGALTLLIRIENLPAATGPANGLLYAAKARGGVAKLDGSDTWDVDTTSVTGGDITKPHARLTGAVSMVEGKRVWNATADELALPAVFISGATGSIGVAGARVEIDLESKRGTIAGYAGIANVKSVVSGVLAQQKSPLCPGNSLYEAVMTNIGRTADMPAKLPHDPGKACAALSLGLGVEMVAGTLGNVVPTGGPKTDPCAPDAGPKDTGGDAPGDAADTSVGDAIVDALSDVLSDVTSDVTAD
jgi:hypothetical protein